MMSLRDDMLAWGRRPPTPGMYCFRARIDAARCWLSYGHLIEVRILELVSEIGSGGQDDPR